MGLRLAPSILDADPLALDGGLRMMEDGQAAWVHLDVMDGHFVPNITFGPFFAAAVGKRTKLPMEAHLMVENPQNHFEAFVKAGVKRIIYHAEGNPHIHRLAQQLRDLGASPGIVLNPGTPLDVLDEVLPYIDMVLLMTVNPGWGGQKFIPSMFDKIRRLRQRIDAQGRPMDLEVDGGVNASTIADCARAGANLFVVGSAIFKAADPAAALKAFVATDVESQPTGGQS